MDDGAYEDAFKFGRMRCGWTRRKNFLLSSQIAGCDRDAKVKPDCEYL